VKPYLGDQPRGWLDNVVENEVSEFVEQDGTETKVLEEREGECDEASPVDSGSVNQPLASEPADVITFNESQEFRRNRPRRNIRRSVRFND